MSIEIIATGIFIFAVGFLFGILVSWPKISSLKTTIELITNSANEKTAFMGIAEEKFRETFAALSASALTKNNENFLHLAKTSLENYQTQAKGDLEKRQKAVEVLVKPINEQLKELKEHNENLDKARNSAYIGLLEQVKGLSVSQEKLQKETGKLVTALRAPQTRGQWGEIQLRRVVEMAGMVEYCDFVRQQSVLTDQGILRPDLIVNLPAGKQIVVDAKAPMSAFLEAIEATDDKSRITHLQNHAEQIRQHMKKLSQKAYWEQFPSAPEFVVMFLPGESFFSAALEQDSTLIELGVGQQIILATPTTLIATLRAVAYGWRQERITESAEKISKLGTDLYDRLAVMTDHFGKVGTNLDRATKAYNDTIGSLERSVLSAARKFPELGVASKRKLAELEPGESTSREIQAKELLIDHNKG